MEEGQGKNDIPEPRRSDNLYDDKYDSFFNGSAKWRNILTFLGSDILTGKINKSGSFFDFHSSGDTLPD